jgi:hypothetical protein
MKFQASRKFLAVSLALFLGVWLAGPVPAQETTRKTDGPLGRVHAAEGIKCTSCHGRAKQTEPVALEKCLSCHGDGDSKALAAKTANVKPLNPHESRHYGTEADCGLCHRQHEPSVNFCLDCHPRFDFKVK